jgi:hypothetical protein
VFKNGWDPEGHADYVVGGHRNNAQYLNCTFKDTEAIGLFSPLGYNCFENCSASNISDYPFHLYSSSFVFLQDAADLVNVPPNPSKKDPSSRIVNHPNGLIQEADGNPKSRGTLTLDSGVRMRDETESDSAVVLRNEGGQLVGFDSEGNRLGTVRFD